MSRTQRPVPVFSLAALLLSAGCANFVMTATQSETLDAVREAMTRAGATEESKTLRPDLDPEEIELTFVRPPPDGAARDDIRTIFVRIVPWESDGTRRRTITIDAWRWHGVPPMWGGSAKEAQEAANRAMNEVLAERGE